MKVPKKDIYRACGSVRQALISVRAVVRCEEEIGDSDRMVEELDQEVFVLKELIRERTVALEHPGD